MKLALTAILVILTMPVCAQDHPNAAKLKADAENAVKIIGSDKAKIQTYCQFADISDAISEAIHEQDTTKAGELSEKANELEGKLGPEFAALANDLKNMDMNSQDDQEVGAILDQLDEFCGD